MHHRRKRSKPLRQDWRSHDWWHDKVARHGAPQRPQDVRIADQSRAQLTGAPPTDIAPVLTITPLAWRYHGKHPDVPMQRCRFEVKKTLRMLRWIYGIPASSNSPAVTRLYLEWEGMAERATKEARMKRIGNLRLAR